jgi:ABC-type antimicrobial peptide transport system permease subunit
MYLSALQRPYRSLSYVLQAGSGSAAALAPLARAEVQNLDPTLPAYDVRTMAEVIEQQTKADSILAVLLAMFAGVALLMAVLGVYGVMAYGVTQRTQEVGIRMAIGAQPADIVGMMVRQGARLSLIGIVIGLALAAACARLLSFFLFGVSPFDVPTFAAVTLALAAASLFACWLPTRRATRISPVIALRSD